MPSWQITGLLQDSWFGQNHPSGDEGFRHPGWEGHFDPTYTYPVFRLCCSKLETRYISQIPPPKSNTLPLNIYHPLNKRKGIIFQASFFQGFWLLNLQGVVFLRLTSTPPHPRGVASYPRLKLSIESLILLREGRAGDEVGRRLMSQPLQRGSTFKGFQENP